MEAKYRNSTKTKIVRHGVNLFINHDIGDVIEETNFGVTRDSKAGSS